MDKSKELKHVTEVPAFRSKKYLITTFKKPPKQGRRVLRGRQVKVCMKRSI